MTASPGNPQRNPATQIQNHDGWLCRHGSTTRVANAQAASPASANGTIGGSSGSGARLDPTGIAVPAGASSGGGCAVLGMIASVQANPECHTAPVKRLTGR